MFVNKGSAQPPTTTTTTTTTTATTTTAAAAAATTTTIISGLLINDGATSNGGDRARGCGRRGRTAATTRDVPCGRHCLVVYRGHRSFPSGEWSRTVCVLHVYAHAARELPECDLPAVMSRGEVLAQ
jgi:hypothetical protein